MHPKILITSFKVPTERMGGLYQLENMSFTQLSQDYVEAVASAGGYPYVLPYVAVREDSCQFMEELLADFDGVIFPGGNDADPSLYNAYPEKKIGRVEPKRDRWELKLMQVASEMGKPILGICRGFQLMNIFYGGSLHADICESKSKIPHMALMMPKDYPTHLVTIKDGTNLSKIFPDRSEITVNSYHHQAINRLGAGLTVNGVSPDGVIESIEDKKYPYFFGVQWHPEMMFATNSLHLNIFKDFVDFAAQNNDN